MAFVHPTPEQAARELDEVSRRLRDYATLVEFLGHATLGAEILARARTCDELAIQYRAGHRLVHHSAQIFVLG